MPSCRAFSSASALGSANSAADCSALFVRFTATMAESDFSPSCIAGFGSSPSRREPIRLAPPVNGETSRFPYKERAYMPGSQTTQSRSHARVDACDRMAFRRSDGVGAPNEAFAAQWLAYTSPCRRFACRLPADTRTARGRCGSLLLHRSGLAPPAPCRSPGAPDPVLLCFTDPVLRSAPFYVPQKFPTSAPHSNQTAAEQSERSRFGDCGRRSAVGNARTKKQRV